MKGAFIHDVIAMPQNQREALREKGVRVFDTYLGAALEAHDLGLISSEGVRRVAQAAQSDLLSIQNWKTSEQKADRQKELQTDLLRMTQRLKI